MSSMQKKKLRISLQLSSFAQLKLCCQNHTSLTISVKHHKGLIIAMRTQTLPGNTKQLTRQNLQVSLLNLRMTCKDDLATAIHTQSRLLATKLVRRTGRQQQSKLSTKHTRVNLIKRSQPHFTLPCTTDHKTHYGDTARPTVSHKGPTAWSTIHNHQSSHLANFIIQNLQHSNFTQVTMDTVTIPKATPVDHSPPPWSACAP